MNITPSMGVTIGIVGVEFWGLVSLELEARREAAMKFRPAVTRLLLVAEMPPADPKRYFSFTNVSAYDSRFRSVFESLLGRPSVREDKANELGHLRSAGVFLIDLKETSDDGPPSTYDVPRLLQRCEEIAAERIVLIKANVYDLAFEAMKTNNMSVVDRRIPFPSSGQQGRFRDAFGAVLLDIGWERPDYRIPTLVAAAGPCLLPAAIGFLRPTVSAAGVDPRVTLRAE